MKKSYLVALALSMGMMTTVGCSKDKLGQATEPSVLADEQLSDQLGRNTEQTRQDSLALVAIYNQTNGAGWYRHHGWLSSRPISQWEHVKVASVGGVNRVVGLYLGGDNLDGKFPKELGNLTALRKLDLSYNYYLTGNLPEELYNLKHLQVLKLKFASMTGSLSARIGNLSQLDTLDISASPKDQRERSGHAWQKNELILTGSIPQEIGQLRKLRYLALADNAFTGSIPQEIGNLSSLEYLNLSGCPFSGGLPTSIGKLHQLRRLWISKARFTQPLPQTIGDLRSLTHLYITESGLSGSIPASIAQLKNLEALSLRDNQLSGNIPAGISDLSKLYVVYLQNNQLGGEVPRNIAGPQQPWFIQFNAENNNLTGSLPALTKKTLPGPYADDPETYGLPTYGYVTISLGGNRLSGLIPASYKDSPKNVKANLSQQTGYGFGNAKEFEHARFGGFH